ncbi:Pterin deaminase [Halomicronema hongdechloris C2206]|uniref:Pterin deaminase n=1 Tax=Halomicronema hongdechloris C2206 TaxID=1641165 RepID=A0A1Z3HMZ8_9CYAN|nr:cytosine deaminase [Halomicronema hongdechloris]ASC71655.1 Pterin deaminase [Halomicronema hongdechloris C2206]
MPIQPFITPPAASHYWLTQARIPLSLLALAEPSLPSIDPDLVAADLEIKDGAIATIVPAGTAADSQATISLNQAMIWPGFIDIHTHLDKGHIWPRQRNSDGTFDQALMASEQDRQVHWNADDLYRRMSFGLRCSYAHGTTAVRTHLDAFAAQAPISFEVFETLRQEWAGNLELQAVCLVPLELLKTDYGPILADLVAQVGGILGGVTYAHPALDALIDRAFTLAQERHLPLDFHVDESLNPDDDALGRIARAALLYSLEQPVVCGHCCSLSVQSEAKAAETISLIKAAGIGIVSLPLCNLYLQHRRPGRTPRYRGITLVQELAQAGVPVAFASDNCRDPFFAYGDHDGLEVFTQSVRIGQLDRPLGAWPRAVTQTPADLMGLPRAGRIAPGLPADLVIFPARSFNELLCRPQADRLVLRQGRAIDSSPPAYQELDALMG